MNNIRPRKFMRDLRNGQSLTLVQGAFSEDEWNVILKIFGMEEAEMIEITNFKFKARGVRKGYFGTEDMWHDAYQRITSIGGASMFGYKDSWENADTYAKCEIYFERYLAGERTEDFYKEIIEFSENVIINV